MIAPSSRRGPRRTHPGILAIALLLVTPALGCGEDEVKATAVRGVPGAKKPRQKGAGKAGSRRTNAPAASAGGVELEPDAEPLPQRPLPTLDATAFAKRRDPFQGFVASEPVRAEPDPIRAEREVRLRQYSFDDLRLIVIANSRRAGVRPQARFLATDGVSGTVQQGEHFSSAEVLLAAVNQGYVEIQVVDEKLATSLGMENGERRALYLTQD